MAEPDLDAAFDVLQRGVADGLVPGAVAAVGTASDTLRRAAFGHAQLVPERRAIAEDSLFDLASLTKVVVTATLLLRSVERGLVHLDQRVASVLPAFGAAGKEEVTLRHLATHTSGLPAWIDLHPSHADRNHALNTICCQPLERPAGASVVYSDLGFITLGAVLATVGGASLDRLAAREIFGPLGMHETRYGPPPSLRPRCVTTEVMEDRGGAITGVVHDENAAGMGGVSGHAGLFATCADLERFCRAWLGLGQVDGVRLLSPAAVRAATRDQTGPAGARSGSRRGLGWVLQPNPLWVPADLCSPTAYSHTGFTGTSLLLDPQADVFAVLLTNRVHPTRGGDSPARIRALRARFHNAVWAALAT